MSQQSHVHVDETVQSDGTVVLVYGASGFLGTRIMAHLQGRLPRVVAGRSRLEDTASVQQELDSVRPTHVFCCVGVGRAPSATWHDYHTVTSMRGNVLLPCMLVDACHRRGIHCTVLGSGVVQSRTDAPVDESAAPCPSASAYGRIRALSEGVLEPYLNESCLVLRVMYPVSGDGDPMCLLSKLQSYPILHDTPSSISILPDLLPTLVPLLRRRQVGLMNWVNPGTVSPKDIVGIVMPHTQKEVQPLTDRDKARTAAAWLSCDRLQDCLPRDVVIPDCKRSLLQFRCSQHLASLPSTTPTTSSCA